MKAAGRISLWVIVAAAIGGLVVLAKSQRTTISELRGQVASQQENLRELDRLRAENKELQRLKNQQEELDRLRADNRELLRLRDEMRTLREQLREADTLRAANAQLLQAVQSTPLQTNQLAWVTAARNAAPSSA